MAKSVQLTGSTHKVLAQVNQSDLAFLRERARAVEAELWMAMDANGKPTLNARTRSDRGAGSPIKLGWRNELQDKDGDAFGMFCSLSIPIVTLCALILLIILVTLFDIFFKWLPFLFFCFPVKLLSGKRR
jgi:hypothetical protein